MRPLCCKCLHSSVLCVGDLCGTCWQTERTALTNAEAQRDALAQVGVGSPGALSQKRALAESQAREWALRQAARSILDYQQDHDECCPRARSRHDDCDCGYGDVEVALATPADDSALREFGRRVAERDRRDLPGEQDPAAVVDAVLRGKS